MDECNHVEEVIERLTTYEIPIPTDESDVPLTECDSTEHDEDTELREGNRVFAVIAKTEDSWDVTDIVCWTCSVRPIFQKYKGDNNVVAVVEGTLRETPAHVEQTDVYLESPEIWEVTTNKPS